MALTEIHFSLYLIVVRVKIYSGHKGEERPQSLILGDKEYQIEILRSELREDYKTRERRTTFLCEAAGRLWRIEWSGEAWQVYEK